MSLRQRRQQGRHASQPGVAPPRPRSIGGNANQMLASLGSIIDQFSARAAAPVDRNVSNRNWCRSGRKQSSCMHNISDEQSVELKGTNNEAEGQDFSYLKKDLTVDETRDKEEGQARIDELQTIEDIVQSLREHVNHLSGKTESNDDQMKEEVRRLKAYIKDLGCMVIHLQQGEERPFKVNKEGKPDNLLRECPHHGRRLDQDRDRLADLKNKYEQSLLITPTDVNWPFIHMIDSNRPPLNPDSPDCTEESQGQ